MAKESKDGTKKIGTVACKIEGEILHIFIPFDKTSIDKAPKSNSGKMKLVGSTGGFQKVDGTPLSLNLSAGVRVDD